MNAPPTAFWIDEVASPLGAILLVARDGKLASLDYGDCRQRLLTALTARYGAVELQPADDPFGFSSRIREYLAGDVDTIAEIPVDTGGTAFQQTVWAALRRIPAGRALAYADLAREIGRPAAARAVGAANGRNPISIVVPCHRLIGRDDSLTGYGGGLWRKRWLLEHEGARARVNRREWRVAAAAGG